MPDKSQLPQYRRSADLLGPGIVRRAYDDFLHQGGLASDNAQLDLVRALDELAREIASKNLSLKSSSLGWLFGKKQAQKNQTNGLYIWGGVGRGKTVLMDLFFDAVILEPKRRVHFNDFMQEAHALIHTHRKNYKSGKTREEDPVPSVAKHLADGAKLLCFDEFSVSDIADAMLLSRLFTGLFEAGVFVVATSNIAPQDLYRDGLNRQLFLPFVELLVTKVKTHQLLSETDYRLSKLSVSYLYNWPLNRKAQSTMEKVWNTLSDGVKGKKENIQLKGRQIQVACCAKGVVRFQFDQLCREPRGAEDYLAITHRYSTIMIENVPVMLASERNEARRFTVLIDVLYDNTRKVIISADGPPDALFQGQYGKEAFEFERTASRLIEMQSAEYMLNSSNQNLQDLQAIESV